MKIEGSLTRRGTGLYDVMDDVGAHEVIIETPDHIANMAELDVSQIQRVFETYIVRINDLEKDLRFKYTLPYKNYGWSAGGGKIKHCRSQIIATPITPIRVKDELLGAKKYFELHERCIYCDLIFQECRDQTRVVCENDQFVAIAPFAARFPFEMWVLPKKHHCDFSKGAPGTITNLASMMKVILLKLKKGLEDPAYNYVVHSAPFRRESPKDSQWKTINDDYHWHVEVMPRLTHVAGFEKGTGFYICSIPPENTAEYLRGVKV